MTTDEQTLDAAYFEWLTTQVRIQHGADTYRELHWVLYKKEFVWIVPNDDNRVADGLDLLADYFREHGMDARSVEHGNSCSFLEMIIALSRRCAFTGGGDPVEWAWHLLCNIGLDKMADPLSGRDHNEINGILDRVIWRTYAEDGSGGGLFPLMFAKHDQRLVELWYQMNSYIGEQEYRF